jgi:epoxyqueuosine reductase
MRARADTDWVLAKAEALGFDLCGVAPAESWDELTHRDEWLARGYAGEMRYLRDARRADPVLVLPEAKSVIVCALNYNTPQPYSTEAAAAGNQAHGWISRYAWGEDYHSVLGEKLESLVAALRAQFGAEIAARAYVDTGPVAERVAAWRAGLGWLAKNTCLINERAGSWLFLGVVLTSLELVPSVFQDGEDRAAHAPPDLCGNCRLCLDACPTGALAEPYVLDARRCVSYLTIELRGSIPEEFRGAMGWQVFGCDICQDVCPWNQQAPVSESAVFMPREKLVVPEIEWLLSLSEDGFRETFRNSAIRRAKWRGLVRNACVAAGNAARRPEGLGATQAGRLRMRLAELASAEDGLIAEHAKWALAQWDGAARAERSGRSAD